MIAQAIALMPSPVSCSVRMRTAVAPMARAMPAADRRLPFRAVAGEFIRGRPRTNATAPASQAIRTRISIDLEVVTRLGLRSSAAGLGAAGFLRNIWSIRSVTT